MGWKTPLTLYPKSQLTDISHTPNEQVGSGPRHAPPGVCLDPDNPLPFGRRKGEPDFPWYGLTATYTRVVDLVHRREDVPWTDAQLSAVVCSKCKNQTVIEKGCRMELSARDVNDARASHDRTASPHRWHSPWGLDDSPVSALTDVDTDLATQAQAPPPDISYGIDNECMLPGDTNHAT